MATLTTQREWITLPEARRRAAIGREAMSDLITGGVLTVRAIPGSWPKVLASEVDALVERSTRRATPSREHAACV